MSRFLAPTAGNRRLTHASTRNRPPCAGLTRELEAISTATIAWPSKLKLIR